MPTCYHFHVILNFPYSVTFLFDQVSISHLFSSIDWLIWVECHWQTDNNESVYNLYSLLSATHMTLTKNEIETNTVSFCLAVLVLRAHTVSTAERKKLQYFSLKFNKANKQIIALNEWHTEWKLIWLHIENTVISIRTHLRTHPHTHTEREREQCQMQWHR